MAMTQYEGGGGGGGTVTYTSGRRGGRTRRSSYQSTMSQQRAPVRRSAYGGRQGAGSRDYYASYWQGRRQHARRLAAEIQNIPGRTPGRPAPPVPWYSRLSNFLTVPQNYPAAIMNPWLNHPEGLYGGFTPQEVGLAPRITAGRPNYSWAQAGAQTVEDLARINYPYNIPGRNPSRPTYEYNPPGYTTPPMPQGYGAGGGYGYPGGGGYNFPSPDTTRQAPYAGAAGTRAPAFQYAGSPFGRSAATQYARPPDWARRLISWTGIGG